jgi:NAD(P)H-quinone oxidoreductase subunit 5
VALAIVALGLSPLLWLEQGAHPTQLLRSGALVLGLTQVYFLWHWLFAGLAAPGDLATTPLVVWTMLCLTLLYVAQTWIRCYPRGRLAGTLYPWAYCGFYLDETFTRLTFKVWPARLSPEQAGTLVNRQLIHQGECV